MKRSIFPTIPLIIIFHLFLMFNTASAQDANLVEDVEIRGNRAIPTETIKLYVQTKKGDPYSESQVQRDYQAILAQGFFDEFDSRVFTEDGPRGGKVVIFFVQERPVIRDITYQGLKSAQESDVIQRFRERRVQVSKESRYDPVLVEQAKKVLKELLSEKGKPNAEVLDQVEPISATTVAVNFVINEGQRVRITTIDFDGNNVFSDRKLRRAMKLTKQSGFLTSLGSKDIYDKRKLDDDLRRVQLFIGEKGYLRPQIGEPELENVGKVGLPIPLLGRRGEGVKVKIPIIEGPRYTFGKLKVEGNTLFNQEQIFAVTGLKTGDVASLKVIREGVYERLRKLYGRSGYIQATTDLRPEYNPDGTADFTITVDEGKPFRIGRIEFQGNTVTRDTVLRREILVNEGDLYNQELFDFSRLRLNQLGYFEEIKEEDAQFQTDERNGVVDITVRVKEKGRQQVSFTGGVSGAAGSFIGVSYATNNLFGYGESLSFDVQAGNRQRSFSVSFTEPYLRGRPISAGVSIFTSRLKFFSGGLGGSFFGNSANFADDRFNSSLFTRTSSGFSVNLNAPLSLFTKRNLNITRFTRLGLSYSFSSSSLMDPEVNRDDDPNNDIFISFREPSIKISSISPSIVYNTLNNPIDPTMGRSLSATFNFSGLGGDVKVFTPAIEVKYFRPVVKREKPQVIGMRFLFENSTSFGSSGQNNNSFFGGIPIFNRFFLGGEDTLRGYNVRSLSPVSRVDSFITVSNVQSIQELNNKVLPVLKPGRRFRGVKQGTLTQFFFDNASNDIPGNIRFTPIGGDTQLLYNVEYRIPIIGPLTLALFLDAGSAFNLRGIDQDQIRATNPGREIVGRDSTLPFNPIFQPTSFILNPRGKIATPREVIQARTPETPADQLPRGFRFVRFEGDVSRKTIIRLSNNDFGGFRRNFRSSVGGELRIQVPVVNVPFRLIYAYNPNSKTGNQPGQIFIEDKSLFRFSIGRTF